MALPSDLSFGFVSGRFVLAVGDTLSDPDHLPDAQPAMGTVRFQPVVTRIVSTLSTPTLILPQRVEASIGPDGDLLDPAGRVGVWLVAGQYKVSFQFGANVTLPEVTIEVGDEHTEANPLWLPTLTPTPTEPALKWVVNEAILNEAKAARDEAVAAANSVPLGTHFRPIGAHSTGSVAVSATPWTDPVSYAWNHPSIAHLSGTPTPVEGGGSAHLKCTGGTNQQSQYIGFVINDDEFQVHAAWIPPGGCDITIVVDGQRVGGAATIIPAGDQAFVTVTGLGEGPHEVIVVLGGIAAFAQVLVRSGVTVSPYTGAEYFSIWGDSYTDLGVPPFYGGLALEIFLLTGLIPLQQGQGSTGYCNDAEGVAGKSPFGSASRLAAFSAFGKTPRFIFILGSINDGAHTPAQVSLAASSLYHALDGLTTARLIVAGMQPLWVPHPDGIAINAALRAAAEAAPNVVKFIDWLTEDWLTGTGYLSDPKFDGNQDGYIGTPPGFPLPDTIHANVAGNRMLARRFVAAIAGLKV